MTVTFGNIQTTISMFHIEECVHFVGIWKACTSQAINGERATLIKSGQILIISKSKNIMGVILIIIGVAINRIWSYNYNRGIKDPVNGSRAIHQFGCLVDGIALALMGL